MHRAVGTATNRYLRFMVSSCFTEHLPRAVALYRNFHRIAGTARCENLSHRCPVSREKAFGQGGRANGTNRISMGVRSELRYRLLRVDHRRDLPRMVAWMKASMGETGMTRGEMLYLGLVLAAFVCFAVTLFYQSNR